MFAAVLTTLAAKVQDATKKLTELHAEMNRYATLEANLARDLAAQQLAYEQSIQHIAQTNAQCTEVGKKLKQHESDINKLHAELAELGQAMEAFSMRSDSDPTIAPLTVEEEPQVPPEESHSNSIVDSIGKLVDEEIDPPIVAHPSFAKAMELFSNPSTPDEDIIPLIEEVC